MTALTVVENLKVLKDRGWPARYVPPAVPVKQLDLHTCPERLHHCVVPRRQMRSIPVVISELARTAPTTPPVIWATV